MPRSGRRFGRGARGWALALAVTLIATSCGGTDETDQAVADAEEALANSELWDPQAGGAAPKPVRTEKVDAAEFATFMEAEPQRSAHLLMAAEMGYTTLLAAGRTVYDDDSVVTTAALAGDAADMVAMLVIGTMAPNATTPEPPEVVFVAVPVYEGDELVRVDFTAEKGALSLDVGAEQVDLVEAEYGSCAPWNCLAGAIAFWWRDDSVDKDAYLKIMGEVCLDCIALPVSQPVACPACAIMLAAPLLASLTLCTVWPCELCVSDSCHATETVSAQCVTENGLSRIESSVTPWHCANASTQESECVSDDTYLEVVPCPRGCTPGSPTCQFATECLVGAPFACGTGVPTETYCSGDTAVALYQKYRCVSDDPAAGGAWGTCEPIVGEVDTRYTSCPFACADGACQLGPTCDPTVCEELRVPIGEAYCTVRPDDGKSVLVQEILPRGCVTVEPHTSLPIGWPEAQSCEPLEPTVETLAVCPGTCTVDRTACGPAPALVLNADGVNSWVFGDPAAEVVAGLTSMLGNPDDTHNDGLGCYENPADPATCEQLVRWAGFTVVFGRMGGGDFVGYSLDTRGAPDSIPAATPEGIGVESTVAALESAYPDASWQEAFCSGIQGYVWPPDYAGYRFGRSAENTVDLIYVGYIPLFC